jgi:serine/threonine protein kinase
MAIPSLNDLLPQLQQVLQQTLQDNSLELIEQLQELWSGYGSIVRCYSKNKDQSYIVKHIQTSNSSTEHPRGWSGDKSHQRKIKSYQVETEFYRHFATFCNKDINQKNNKEDKQSCKVPSLYKIIELDDGYLLVMEDLHASGFNISADKNDWPKLKTAIIWLANFHSKFMFNKFMFNSADNLWSQGGYWHLDTRQDELAAMPESNLKQQAAQLDKCLKKAKYQTLIHGDAKFDNLCFHTNGNSVAAVDFQYVGRGVGVVDLAYLAGSALDQSGLEEFGELILPFYLNALKRALLNASATIDFEQLSKEYETLYPVAWADFYRFLLGWNPQSWKVNDYIKQMTEKVLSNL